MGYPEDNPGSAEKTKPMTKSLKNFHRDNSAPLYVKLDYPHLQGNQMMLKTQSKANFESRKESPMTTLKIINKRTPLELKVRPESDDSQRRRKIKKKEFPKIKLKHKKSGKYSRERSQKTIDERFYTDKVLATNIMPLDNLVRLYPENMKGKQIDELYKINQERLQARKWQNPNMYEKAEAPKYDNNSCNDSVTNNTFW